MSLRQIRHLNIGAILKLNSEISYIRKDTQRILIRIFKISKKCIEIFFRKDITKNFNYCFPLNKKRPALSRPF
jgi:hypothetical protein